MHRESTHRISFSPQAYHFFSEFEGRVKIKKIDMAKIKQKQNKDYYVCNTSIFFQKEFVRSSHYLHHEMHIYDLGSLHV